VKYVLLIMTFFTTSVMAGSQLDAKAVFYRCYAHLTQSYLMPNDPLLAQVKNGSINPVDACMQVLNRAKFTKNDGRRIADDNDESAKRVLSTMHRLHYSWFTQRFIKTPEQYRGERDLYDVSAPASYITKALFDPNMGYGDIFYSKRNASSSRTQINLSPTRINGHNNGVFTFLPKSSFAWDSTGALATDGEMVGVSDLGNKCHSYNDGGNTGTACIGSTTGGGVLGSHPYMMLNLMEPFGYRSNGGTVVGRNWGKNVYQDFFCRELPVVREIEVVNNDDGQGNSLVNINSTVPFRTASGCVKCHASMDRIAFTIRNVYYPRPYAGGEGASGRLGYHVTTRSPDQSKPSIPWPIDNDGSGERSNAGLFYRRPPEGWVFF
jgi:hypothetical protein